MGRCCGQVDDMTVMRLLPAILEGAGVSPSSQPGACGSNLWMRCSCGSRDGMGAVARHDCSSGMTKFASSKMLCRSAFLHLSHFLIFHYQVHKTDNLPERSIPWHHLFASLSLGAASLAHHCSMPCSSTLTWTSVFLNLLPLSRRVARALASLAMPSLLWI